MPAFEYTALKPTGRQARGVLEGDTPRQVRQQLREKGFTPLSVEAVQQREKRRLQLPGISRGISAMDLSLVTRQLATLVRSGLPLEEALGTVARQSEKARIRSMLMAVRTRVMEGHTLARGLGDFPHVFPDIYRTTVSAGEQSGHLDVVLDRLADYTENRQQMRQKIQLALFYPAILTTMALLVTVALLTYVVPEVVQVFVGIGQELPWLTRTLIAVSDGLRDYGLYLLGGLALGALLVERLLRRPRPLHAWHALLLRLPLVGRLTRGINTARFARTLAILSSSGVTVLEALRIAAQVMANRPMRAAVETVAQRVREGSGIGVALERTGYFPPMTVHLIRSGEASGALDDMLDRAAANQERELETRIAVIMGVLEPLLILVMAVVVLIIVLAILLPIFELNQLVT
ncbi:general secretion pathway protein GspF [Ectothiorhodospira haloalkaliphila]|uniref:General secretion pathway protein F n=1 Tax=Ectothiorhodospira haloalkaliphila TaxID=421628 RepID=W8KFU9_9GAMM|nr:MULTISPECIES: type II secretion system inner membrane protein GspF [Ectothiorhodospira]AHK78058.1 general secretion pathway protein GspF [Ectothiorhodospira haloalkaliphila]MCG5494340.1 type II secretion system inner membrane protein GspF [Ectothiorhodospira variabilis]MCG5504107.1 type II secretion system inner membrane protein GspF [Ectothiorhodospira variabilis]MCG5507262.1 type II secretion system inner membrane protein GspF [Ectothiorhodospira variabilis]